jgi:DNA-binding MarR family transcriptional regulator
MSTVPPKVASHNSDADAAALRLHHLLMDVVRASGLLETEQAAPGHPLSLSQAFALHELDTGEALSQQELANRLRLDKSSVSRLAAELQRRGLLVRQRDPGNRRTYRLVLTEAGRALHRDLGQVAHSRYVHWVRALSVPEREALLAGLPALLRVIREVG